MRSVERDCRRVGLKSRRCLIQSGMVIACVARGQRSHPGAAVTDYHNLYERG